MGCVAQIFIYCCVFVVNVKTITSDSTGMISDLEYRVCSVTNMTAMLLSGALRDDFIR